MGQQNSRVVFDGVLTKTHVEHALVQQDGQHNDLPLALTTLLFLDGTLDMFHAIYELKKNRFSSWIPSPSSIVDEATKLRFLGDTRYALPVSRSHLVDSNSCPDFNELS